MDFERTACSSASLSLTHEIAVNHS